MWLEEMEQEALEVFGEQDSLVIIKELRDSELGEQDGRFAKLLSEAPVISHLPPKAITEERISPKNSGNVLGKRS